MVDLPVSEQQGALRQFMKFEQCNLWKPESWRAAGVTDRTIERYLPERRPVFRVPFLRIKRKYMYLYGRQQASAQEMSIEGGNGCDDEVVFPVHPSEMERCSQLLNGAHGVACAADFSPLRATPTSSTRTLLLWPEEDLGKALFVKLSMQSRMLGDRRLSRRVVARSIGLSAFFRAQQDTLPARIRCLHEPFGLVQRLMPEAGVVFRSIPDEVKAGRVVLAPLFALIGGGAGHRPLLLQLMDTLRVDACEAIEEVLLAGFARLWVDLVFGSGLILEAHGQDLLLALTPGHAPLGNLYYRDFEGLAVDWALRRKLGLPEASCVPHAWEWFPTYDTWGHRLYQLVSNKIRVSLFDYVHLFLAEVESALMEWEAAGVIAGRETREGDLTALFSHHLRKAICDKFGIHDVEQYDIRYQLCRFVKFLMHVRREIMCAYGTSCAR